eukprot:Seg1197.3 transcript_id=Seg1197.3/GoldUCD/mRNA.D3Y31 product="hypothetical protein" protein_id=Seg1197.3/GoldUCD/D3Y31
MAQEIAMLRLFIRRKRYFKQLETDKVHKNVSGTQVLNADRIDFSSMAKENFQSYVNAQTRGEPFDYCPVYVTEEDRKYHEDVERWTMKKINVLKSCLHWEAQEESSSLTTSKRR